MHQRIKETDDLTGILHYIHDQRKFVTIVLPIYFLFREQIN